MELFILGAESPYPRRGRATLGYTLAHAGFLLVLETGFGIHRRLAEEGLLDRVGGILLSHLHCDHSADLPAVAPTLWSAILVLICFNSASP